MRDAGERRKMNGIIHNWLAIMCVFPVFVILMWFVGLIAPSDDE
jgi:hypothetical protein